MTRRKNKQIIYRVTESVFDNIDKLAKLCGMKKQEFLDIAVHNQAKFLVINEDEKEIEDINPDEEKIYFIRFKLGEYKKVEEKRKKSRMTKQEFGRRALLDKEIIFIEGLNDLVYELNKIGVNLNQITRVANETKIVNEGQIKAVGKMEKEIWLMINNFLSKIKDI